MSVRAPRGSLTLVAVTDELAREHGLMCVTSIPADMGMIFVFEPPQRDQAFWMKDTLVPLDMIFIKTDGVVSNVATDVPATPRGTPDDAVARRSGLGQYVIEVAAGSAARHAIVRGTRLELPALTPKG